MPDTKRQAIVDAMVTRLQTILTGGGYETNAGQNVKVWLERPFAISELPGINVRDSDSTTTVTHGLDQHDLRFELDLFVASSAAVATIRQVIGDVVAAIGTDKTFGGTVIDTLQEEELFQLQHDEKIIAGCQLVFTVQFETQHFDPYT